MAKTPDEARRERLAAALRANLRRRKVGAPAKQSSQADMSDAAPASEDGDVDATEALSRGRDPR
ncbi:MAG TPA: hypothetical protein VGK90_04340 [Rhizomicrobium sp.]